MTACSILLDYRSPSSRRLFYFSQICSNAHPQRVQLDKSSRIGLVIGALVILEGSNARIEQGISLGIPSHHDNIALVELYPHPTIYVDLRHIDQALHHPPFGTPPIPVVNHCSIP